MKNWNQQIVIGIIVLTVVNVFSMTGCGTKNPPEEIISDKGIVLRWIPAGTFTMGSPVTEVGRSGDECPQHQVTLTKGFYMGKYEVTQEQYEAVIGVNPSDFKKAVVKESGTPGKLPVENVTWFDAIEFCNKLSVLEGLQEVYTISSRKTPASGYPITSAVVIVDWSKNGYRLPTEAQWEYACRAGTVTAFNNGNDDYKNVTLIDSVAWYDGKPSGKTHHVGLKTANAWGLYDMHGNVWEWCWDWHGDYLTGAQTDPVGAFSGSVRVWHGGGWASAAENVRSAYRGGTFPFVPSHHLGFRVVRP